MTGGGQPSGNQGDADEAGVARCIPGANEVYEERCEWVCDEEHLTCGLL